MYWSISIVIKLNYLKLNSLTDIPPRLCTSKSSTIYSNNFQDREPGVVTSMLSNLKWESLEGRSTKARNVLVYKIMHNLAEIHAELEGCSLQNDIYTGRYVSLFNLSYHQNLEQHTTSNTSGQYNRTVKCHATESTYSKNSSVIPKTFTIYRSCIKSSIEVLKYN